MTFQFKEVRKSKHIENFIFFVEIKISGSKFVIIRVIIFTELSVDIRWGHAGDIRDVEGNQVRGYVFEDRIVGVNG